MTELARTPPALRRLFDIVDMAPHPHEDAVAQSLRLWKEKSGNRLAPDLADLAVDETAKVREHSLVAEPLAGESDFFVSSIGDAIRGTLRLRPEQFRLSEMANRHMAVRLRRLFRMILDLGEPVVVRFVDYEDHPALANFEVFAAPVMLGSVRNGLFCTIAWRSVPGPLRFRHSRRHSPGHSMSQ
jgi:ribose-phosphate pyrophosphokinase